MPVYDPMWAPPLICTLVSALLYVLPLIWPPAFAVAWLALAPFLAVVVRATPARAAGLGMIWGMVSALAMASWLPGMLSGFFGATVPAGWLGLVGIALLLHAPAYAIFAALLAWTARRGRPGPLLVAALWSGCELLRAHNPWVANPYGLTAYTQVGWPLAVQIADLAGPYGIGFLIASSNALLASLFVPALRGARPRLAAVLGVGAIVLALGYGALSLARPPRGAESVEVALVQTGQAPLRAATRARSEAALALYLELSAAAVQDGAELVLWPESAIDFYLRERGARSDRVLGASRELGAELIVGGPDYAPSRNDVEYFNAAFVVRDGQLRASYAKARLMPFSEWNPLRGIVAIGSDHYARGEVSLLPTTRAPLGLFICSEAMLPEHVRGYVARGARVLANPSNDAWFGSERAARVQLATAQLRAIESRRWLLRPTPTGYSAVIDPLGRLAARSRYGARELIRSRFEPLDVVTVYQRLGDLFPTLGAAFAVLWCLVPERVRARTRVPRSGVQRASPHGGER